MRGSSFRGALSGALVLAAVGAGAILPASAEDEREDDRTALYLVTLDGPGTARDRSGWSEASHRSRLVSRQDEILTALDAEDPVYRWTTALNGFAVGLSAEQAIRARELPGVALVQRDVVRPVAGTPRPGAPGGATTRGHGGRGTVIGVVDTGIATASPALATSTTLGPSPAGFGGTCSAGDGWDQDECSDKVIAATWYVEGFGADNLRAGSYLSPRDDAGHGTQVASIAAGNEKVTALASGRRLGTFSGAAPDARLAVYKACWTAPDPEDDGCSTADVVSAVDRAVADGVDVLNLSVASGPGLDTVDLALLGATEADVFVATAAGNDRGTTGYQQPWVTAVGATTGPDRTGALRLGSGETIRGVLTARRLPGTTRIIKAADAPAPGHTRAQARLCAPGSLDAGAVDGRIVLCERGTVARVDKSSAVHLADGVGMVLVNAAGEELSADLHAVPTLHVSADEGAELRRALRSGDTVRGTLLRTRAPAQVPRVMRWSAHGSTSTQTVKPDLVAPGFGLLAATTSDQNGGRWGLLTGTSGSAAKVSGLAARLRSLHPAWSASRIHSALVSTARPAANRPSALVQGSGVVSGRSSRRPGLVFDLPATAYRRALERGTDYSRLNLPSAQREVPPRGTVITRRVTNVGGTAMYYSSAAAGFTRHQVLVTPAALRIAPGETAVFRVRVTRAPGRPARASGVADSGWVTWRGANGVRVRMPVVLTR